MDVSLTVCEIFSIKQWRELKLELGVPQGRSKWQHSTDHTTYYWSAVVSIALSCTILELFDVE